jgi:hypothetical protein
VRCARAAGSADEQTLCREKDFLPGLACKGARRTKILLKTTCHLPASLLNMAQLKTKRIACVSHLQTMDWRRNNWVTLPEAPKTRRSIYQQNI